MKFVSLSQLLECPLFGSNSDPFTAPGFIVSLVGIKKKKERKEEEEEKKPPAGFKLAKPVLLVFLAAAG